MWALAWVMCARPYGWRSARGNGQRRENEESAAAFLRLQRGGKRSPDTRRSLDRLPRMRVASDRGRRCGHEGEASLRLQSTRLGGNFAGGGVYAACVGGGALTRRSARPALGGGVWLAGCGAVVADRRAPPAQRAPVGVG